MEPVTGDSHQIGDACDIPEGVRHPSVSDIGGKGQGGAPRGNALPGNPQQVAHNEGVPQVVQAMQGKITPRGPAQMPKETAEGIADLPVIDREPVVQQEKPITLGGLYRVVALFRIGTKFNANGLVHGDPAAPVALGLADGQYAFVQVDIRTRQPDGLADAQSGGCQNAQDGTAGGRAQPAGRWQLPGRGQQDGEFVLTEDMRHPVPVRGAEQAVWGYLSAGVMGSGSGLNGNIAAYVDAPEAYDVDNILRRQFVGGLLLPDGLHRDFGLELRRVPFASICHVLPCLLVVPPILSRGLKYGEYHKIPTSLIGMTLFFSILTIANSFMRLPWGNRTPD